MAEKTDKNRTGQMKIGELAIHSGISVSTLYDYLRSGLLPLPEKESPTKAYFSLDHLERLDKIRTLKEQGMTLAEIRESLGPSGQREGEGASEDTRIAIIDKALELFSRFHYENTKISDITDALNMGNGTFYRYFKSKEELFLYCLERLPKVLVPRDAWAEVEKEPDFILRLKKRGYAMLNAFPSYIGILNYAKLSLGKKDLTLAGKAADCIKSLVRPLMNDLMQAIEDGYVRDVDAELCAYLLLGINETFGYLLLMNPDYPVEKGFAVIEDFITHALARRHGLASPSCTGEITDLKDQVVVLEHLQFDGENGVTGRYLEGDLQVALKDIAGMVFYKEERSLFAELTLKNTMKLRLELPLKTRVSGQSPVGFFSIPAEKLKSLGFSVAP